jgi:ferrous iron transport protein B
MGQWLTPIFKPMGVAADNWPATVGLLTGVLAKEVVIGSLNTLYSHAGHIAQAATGDFHLWASLREAFMSVPNNMAELGSAFANPVLSQAPMQSMDQGAYGVMYQRFGGQLAAFAYLLFILLYFPCVSTMAAMLRELHRGWAVFSAFWTTGVAYGVAVGFYQIATFTMHPASSVLWLLAIALVLVVTIAVMHFLTRDEKLDIQISPKALEVRDEPA